jgi:peptidoglycan/xylan/chitin deacetylase (PgdA/CDA1 family)
MSGHHATSAGKNEDGSNGTRWDKRAAAWLIRSGLASRLEEHDARRPNVLRILAYHRVANADPESGLDPTLRSASPAQFAEQMSYLARNYRVLSIEDVLEAYTSASDLPPRSVLVSFDDGYRDFAEDAWPVLHRLGLPAVLFVATDYLNGDARSYWWDRLHVACCTTERTELTLPGFGRWSLKAREERARAFLELKRLVIKLEHTRAMALVEKIVDRLGGTDSLNGSELLRWPEVRRLSSSGVCVAAHTRSHPILSRVPVDAVRSEVVGAQDDLRKELGHAWPVFAYPSGHPADINSSMLDLLAAEGFAVATTMVEGHNRIGREHPLRLKRIGVAPHLSLDEFRLALTSAYDWYGTLARIRTGRVEPKVGSRD